MVHNHNNQHLSISLAASGQPGDVALVGKTHRQALASADAMVNCDSKINLVQLEAAEARLGHAQLGPCNSQLICWEMKRPSNKKNHGTRADQVLNSMSLASSHSAPA